MISFGGERAIANFFWTLQDLGSRRHLLKCFPTDLLVRCFLLQFLLCRGDGGDCPAPPKNPMVCPLGVFDLHVATFTNEIMVEHT